MKRAKWLSVLLSTVMILAVIPTIVSAAGAEASADGVEYPTLQEAIAAGGNVKLLQNVTVNSIITVDKSVTLDLGDLRLQTMCKRIAPSMYQPTALL